ncbi:MAG: MFS transporter [Microbacterium sp. SCN 70-200]|uniref:SulP family inorganic anion transporter n=1 Tax=unclassified Microbacterium TaxID=2609290 RepID=UPI0008696109|nr:MULTISPECIES: SulP family inorganic anion transporter [unclassified Microbacterium]MBN9214564.1 SulP family inorganic anion transporter [Microbacterium sp.]ODT41456.1 MAG: MFS transporter [Microbacterium sp. SCN 70-200]OJV84064.1 MAG: sodium-independent anion transporter [Microbacterium sp. 70-16]
MTMTGSLPTAPRRSALASLRALLPARADYAQLRRTWRGDLLAGLTVGIVALPLALGFGVSSGLSAEAGLVTAVVAGLIAAVFGGSHVQVSGPTGAMVVVLVPIVASHGVGAVAAVSLLAGIIVVVAGVLRLGRAVSYIPWPVIEGFTVGIGVIIFAQQIPALVSPHTAAASEHSSNAIVAAVQSFAHLDPVYLLWALGAVAIVAACMLGAPRIHRAIPGSLVGIIVVTVLTLVLLSPLARIGVLPSTLPAPALPTLDFETLSALLVPAVTVAALAAIESLLSARVASALADTGTYDPDRELVGQGLASIGSSLFGGMPATGAIARTAVNVRSGGRTRLASVTHAIVLLLVVLAVAGPVGQIPLAALSGVLMMTAVRMVHIDTVRAILRSTKADATAFVATALITVSFDLIVAVIIGVVFAGVFALRSLSRASAVRRDPLTGDPQPGDERIAILHFEGPLFFTAADRVFAQVEGIRDVSVVILRMSQLELVDATGARMLGDIVQALERRGITVLIKGVQPRHEDLFRTVGVLDSLRHHNHLFTELPPAIEHARSHVRRESSTA